MPRYQYAGAPSTPPALTASTISGNLTASTAGTYSFWLQTQNRAGFSLVSTRTEVTVVAGQAIRLTIPASTLPSPSGGVDIRSYSILCSSDSNPLNAVIVAAQPGFGTDGTTLQSPSFTIDLSEDEHLNLSSLSVANSAALPSGSDRVNGMRRSISDLDGQIYEWSAASTAWVLSIPQSFTGYTTNLEAGLGANRSLQAIDDLTEIIYPTYDLSGFSIPVKYWLANNESTAIAQGKRIGVTVSADISGVDTDLSNLPGVVGGLELTFLGFANTTTGALDTTGTGGVGTMTGVGEAINYTGQGDTGLQLQKALPAGSAYVLSIRLSIDTATLSTIVPDGAVIKITPFFFNENAKPNPAAKLTGNVILGDYDRRRLVPTAGINALALNGSGFLDVGNGFDFSNVGEQTVTGLEANTADQNVAINVSGECIVVDTVPDYAALRAIVGTVNGQGKATDWSAAVTLSSSLYVSVEVTYPTAIRLDYDDVIAGSSDGTFNADTVRVYVRPTGGGNAIYWDFPVTPGNASDTFTVGATAGTDSGGTEPPARPSDRFGLYEPADDSFTPTATAGSSVFTSQDYEVAIAFRFDTTITSIDHRTTSGCITEVDGNLSDLFQIVNYLGAPVDSVWDLRSITSTNRATNKEVFCAAEGNPYRWQATETTTQDADLAFSTTTTAGAASGTLRLNNSTLASVTAVYVSETDANPTAIASLLGNIAENQTLRIQSVATETTYAEYLVSAIADSGSYRTITVTHSASSGTFADTDDIVLSWGRDYVRPFDINYPSAGRWVKDDSDQILVLDANPTAAIGEVGDFAVIKNDSLSTYGDLLKKASDSGWTTLFNILPYTLTTANYTQPAASSNVTVSVRNSRLYPVGAFVFVETGGQYEVISKPSNISLQIRNTGASGNASPAATINSGSRIYVSGSQGPAGDAATISVGTTTTLSAGASATVTNSGTSSAATLNFGIPQGTAGADGRTILNGTGAPASGLGTDGDFYIDTDADAIYGPKTAGAWGSATSLIGTAGADGVSGFGLDFTYDSATTATPAAGEIRWNNASPGSATEVYAAEANAAFMDEYFVVGNSIQVIKSNDSAIYATFEITSATDNGSDRTYGVTPSGNAGSFTDGDAVRVGIAAKGGTGAAGADGVSGFGLRYTFSATTTSGPASGELRFDNATIASATEIYVSETDRLSNDVSALLAVASDGSPLLIIDDTDPTAFAYFTLDGQTDNGGDRTLTVTHVASGGTFSGNVSLSYAARGATGATGATGAVSAASALTLTEQGAITSTGANEIDLVNVGNVLQFREESDGTTRHIAYKHPDINAQTGTTYTLALTDDYGIVTMDNASANTLTVPTNASVTFPVGAMIEVWQKGAGITTVEGATGVTINGVSAGSTAMSAQYAAATLRKIATDTWLIAGAIADVA